MDEEQYLLRQQLEKMSKNLAKREAALAEQDAIPADGDATLTERDAVLTTNRTLRMAAEAGVQEVTGKGGARIPISRLVLDILCRSKASASRFPRCSSCRRKAAFMIKPIPNSIFNVRFNRGALKPTSNPIRIIRGL